MAGAPSIDELTRWVAELVVAPASADQVVTQTETATRLRGWIDLVLTELTAAANRFASQGQGPGVDALLRRTGRMSSREAAATAKRASLVGDAPRIGEAMAKGEITAGHADALARVAGKATGPARDELLGRADTLVDAAKADTPEAFERRCERELRSIEADDGAERLERQRRASYVRKWKDPATGMWCGRFALDPVRGRRVFSALDAELDQLWSERPSDPATAATTELEQLAAQALTNLVGHGHATRRPVTELHVHIDVETLRDGLHAHSLCELGDGTPIPVGTARRLACDAEIIPVVLGGAGEPLDLGRSQRVASRAQRRALRSIHRTCAATDCEVDFDRCEIHHVVPWEQGGRSDIANLVPLCWRHHHLVHEGGWSLSIDGARTITMRRPDGTVHAVIPLADADRWPHRHRRRERRPTGEFAVAG